MKVLYVKFVCVKLSYVKFVCVCEVLVCEVCVCVKLSKLSVYGKVLCEGIVC